MDPTRRQNSQKKSSSRLDNIDRFILEQLAQRSWEYESDPEGTEWNELCFDDSIATPFYKNTFFGIIFFEGGLACEYYEY